MLTRAHSRHAAALLVAALLSTSCADDTGLRPWESLPELTTRDSVTAGHAIDVAVVNGGSTSYSYGACSFALERRDEGVWIRVWPTSGNVCAAGAIGLAPGGGMYPRLPGMVVNGEHRVTFSVKESDSDMRHLVVSKPFRVGSSGPVVLEVLDDTVVSGTAVRVRFRNRGAEMLRFDACANGEFETPGGRGWYSFGRNWPCVESADSLSPGEIRVVAVPTPSWDYVRYGVRFAINLTRPDGGTTFANTGPFWVRAP